MSRDELLEALRALPKKVQRGPALLEAEPFRELVALLAERDDAELFALARGDDALLARAALEALAGRDGDAEPLLELAGTVRPRTAPFLLRALDRRVPEGLVSRLLAAAGDAWWGAPLDDLRALIRRRDEEVSVRAVPDDQIDRAITLVDRLGDALPDSVAKALEERRWERDTARELGRIGRVWRPAGAAELTAGLLRDQPFDRDVAAIASALRNERPLLVVGEPGTGRTRRLRAAAGTIAARDWLVLEAGAAEVNAGMSYIGELEGRMRRLGEVLRGKRVAWLIPDFEALLWAGTHRHSATGILDLLLQLLEGGRISLAGEITPAAYERLLRARPAIRDAFEPLRVAPADEPRTLALAREWVSASAPGTDDAVLREAMALGRHFLRAGALPGALLTLLEAARRHADGALAIGDVLQAVSERSGLPLSMLDERERLDVDELRRFFARRVIGQPEAVEVVVERVALIKAGLTDPTRPQAVLLFVGPTGTGKTEIAKALAEHLFGSPDRMIRLDLSEYQTPGSARRVLGQGEPDDPSLVGAIRRQPFSVVLLDEFEKADPGVWDLFLQVFDDGRLSDPRGEPADFRHAVIVMTSNLGARIETGSGVGFSPGSGFSPASVQHEVTRAFRREFLNRIDRVVVFRPLARPVMREILEAELDAVLARRGLRSRQWAVEWDDSALEFLLTAGFTPDLGARPLKRAVERHFLTPLALAIAAHDYPSGDQFLFVRAREGGGLDVTFVDPDAPAESPAPEPARGEAPSLRTLAREGGPSVDVLAAAYDAARGQVEDEAWQAAKADALERMREPGFWDDDGRVAVLADVELRDRIEAGLRTAGSLLGRLRGARRPPAALVRRTAQRLLLLDGALAALAGGEPADALLRVDATKAGEEFAARIVSMYRTWAHERGMRLEVVEERTGRGYRLDAAVGGFAAFRTLAPEAGLHVLEVPDGRGGFDRRRVRVSVAPDVPGGPAPADALAAAAAGRARIVRRYRERPAPLVRDAVRGWRTGRLDLVLAGAFDLME